MAPMDNVRHDAPEDLKRRRDQSEVLGKRGTDGASGSGGDEKKRGYSNEHNGNSNRNHYNEDDRSDDSREGDDDDDEDSPKFGPPSQPPPSRSATFASIVQTTSTAVTTVPTTMAISSITPAASSSLSTMPIFSTTPTFISSLFTTAITSSTSVLPSTTPFTSLADTSSQPRKGVNTDSDDPNSISTETTSTAATALAETAPASSASSYLDLPAQPHHHGNKNHGPSETTEHVLVAFGAIGAFIIFVAAVYLIARMRKLDLFSKLRDRKVSRGGRRGWYGWRRKSFDCTSDAPPKYPGYDEEYPSEMKAVPAQRHLDAFFSPPAMPPLATPQTAAMLSQADTQRQETVREALLDNPAPFGVSPSQPAEQSATQFLYNQNPSYDPNSTYNSNLTFNSNVNTALGGGLSRQASNVYDPAQREINHMSYLSSLSSGFGDAQIVIPESGPTKSNTPAPRQSYRQSRKFSWVRRQEDRDTVYTTASEESAPRFRTINSWVAQQTGRVERQQQSNDEVPNMPEIPKLLQVGVGADHQRKQSEDPAFRHHPGDEIEFARGSRIPSTILDRKTGLN